LRLPPWIGGIRYEHSHRMIAGFTILLTLGIAVWTWLADRRPWMKALAVGAFGTIIVQAILGGMTVRHFLPPAVSTAHAAVAQTFFCIAVAIAVFTGRRWVEEVSQTVKIEDDGRLRTPEYYCEICTISVRWPQTCPCCQGDMLLRMKPEPH